MAGRAQFLVTGGAGFIGSHLVSLLESQGAHVRVLDNFDPQVHGEASPLLEESRLIRGDVRDPAILERALDGVTHVVHLAASVGVGQSMYEITHYCDVNVMGTARLLEAMKERKDVIEKLVVASSMSIYGEGLYFCDHCQAERSTERSVEDLKRSVWEPSCPECGQTLRPIPTHEDKPLRSSSIYAVNKRDQEEMCLVFGRAYAIPTLALRFFNVYGSGQALGNPYTGVAAIFASRLLAGAPPLIFEDGLQSRDFIHVSDIARGCLMALESSAKDAAINLGTGRSFSVLDMANLLNETLGGPRAEVLGTFRQGDIRHCVADITRAQQMLGWEPTVQIEEGIHELVEWVRTQSGSAEGQQAAVEELRKHGLVL